MSNLLVIGNTKSKCKNRKLNLSKHHTKVISFCLSEELLKDNKENESEDDSHLVRLKEDESPVQRFGILNRNCRSIAPVRFNIEDYEEEDYEFAKTTRNKLPNLSATKSIIGLNRCCSSERKSLLNDRFKDMCPDMRKSLKYKIEKQLVQCRKTIGSSDRKSNINRSSLKHNPFVNKHRQSMLSMLKNKENLKKN